jgi:hypothetical protein
MHSLTLAIDRCESGQFHTPDALFWQKGALAFTGWEHA